MSPHVVSDGIIRFPKGAGKPDREMIQRNHLRRALLRLAAFTLIGLVSLTPLLANALPDFRDTLDRARELNDQAHWRHAQVLLDELAPFIDQAELREYADFQLLQARHFVLDDRYEEGLELIESLLERELPADQRVRALQFRANVTVVLRRYEAAFESLSKALSIELDGDDPVSEIETLNMAAYMLGRVGEHEMGIEYGERAVSMAFTADLPKEACVALQRLAPVYKWDERAAESEASYRRGIDVCGSVDNALFVGVLQHGLADLLRREGQADSALPLAETAVAALDDAVYRLGEFEARLVRAEIVQDLGRMDESWTEELDTLKDFFADRELWDQSARLALLRSEQAEESGAFSSALSRLRDYVSARETFLDRERAMRLAYLQVEFDSRLQRQQIELLRETARSAQLEAQTAAQQRRLRTFSWLLVGLLVLMLVSLLFRAFISRRRFRDLSRHDGLSGLVNHTWFFERAQAMLGQSRASTGARNRIVLVIADIDYFKQVNDNYGHRAGDHVIQRTAQRLRDIFPDDALIGRIGGEEFAVLLRVSEVDEALAGIDRFRQSPLRGVQEDDQPITLSFGVSCAQDSDDVDSLRIRADQAMYRAKQAGRNRLEVDPSCSENGRCFDFAPGTSRSASRPPAKPL